MRSSLVLAALVVAVIGGLSLYPWQSTLASGLSARIGPETTECAATTPTDTEGEGGKELSVRLNVVEDTSTGDFHNCRRMVTGPGVNEHPSYPGCTGFVGWEDVTLLSTGEMLCSFGAGYWHASFPTPIDVPDEVK